MTDSINSSDLPSASSAPAAMLNNGTNRQTSTYRSQRQPFHEHLIQNSNEWARAVDTDDSHDDECDWTSRETHCKILWWLFLIFIIISIAHFILIEEVREPHCSGRNCRV